MKKYILLVFMVFQVMIYAGGSSAPSKAYGFMKTTYNNMYAHQNLIKFFGIAINSVIDQIDKKCKSTEDGKECSIDTDVSFTVTKDMAEASEVFFGPGEGYDKEEKITLPKGSLTYKKLKDSRFEFAVTIDTSKISDGEEDDDGESMDENITFSWNSTIDILRVYYEYKGGYNSSFVLIRKSDNKYKMISNGYFNDTYHNEGGIYIMEVQLQDEDKNEIIERMSFKDLYNLTNVPDTEGHEVCSAGTISDINGSVWLVPFALEGTSFGKNGTTISDQIDANVTAHIPADKDNGAILKWSTAPSGQRFVIVKKGEKVDKYSVLGYIFVGYEDCKGDFSNPEYEYFGSESLLADKGATSDTDNLDIYLLNDQNKPTDKISGLWLTKE